MSRRGGDADADRGAELGDAPPLDAEWAAWARLALAGVDREFPHKTGLVYASAGAIGRPRSCHPVFYGCFDWHSAVHGHWLLVRALRRAPRAECADTIRRTLEGRFTAAGLAAEAALFDAPEHQAFERMYGWAWALRLALELHAWDDPDAARWSTYLAPLVDRLTALLQAYLPRLAFPVRTGVHPDTAFALAQALDFARGTGRTSLVEALVEHAARFYGADTNYAAQYEPSGEDFFSPALNEADLMRRVLNANAFAAWLSEFLPGLTDGASRRLLTPVAVTDVTDGRLVHLAGLNLSRAWCLQGIQAGLPPDDGRRPALTASARAHAAAGLRYVQSGHYEGEHWLATFAAYALDGVGLP